MSRHLCCRGMCKVMTRCDHHCYALPPRRFERFKWWSHQAFLKRVSGWWLLGLYSLNGRTTYHKISWRSLEDTKLDVKMIVSFWNLTASRQHCCRGACQISERSERFKPEYCGSETSRNIAVRRPSANTPFTQGLRPPRLPCATTKLARSPMKAERRPNGCLGRSRVVHRTFTHRHGRHGRHEVLSMFKTVAQGSPRKSVAHRSLKLGRGKAHMSQWSAIGRPVKNAHCCEHFVSIWATPLTSSYHHWLPKWFHLVRYFQFYLWCWWQWTKIKRLNSMSKLWLIA